MEGASTRDTCGLTLSTLTLDELSEELERRTKETQKLQEEVENATKFALEKFGCTVGHIYAPSWDSAQQQAAGQRDVSPTINEENPLDDPLHLLTELGRAAAPHEQGNEQIERDVMSDLRMTDSKRHVDQMEKMLRLLEELQAIRRSGDQKLQEAQNETRQLNKKVETLEGNIKELCQTLLSHERTATGPKDAVPTMTDDLQPEEHVKSEDRQTVRRTAQLIASVGQEVVMLNHKLSSSKDSGARVSTKLELLRRSLQQHEVLLGPLQEAQTPGGEQDVTKEEKYLTPQEAQSQETKPHPSKLEEAERQCANVLAKNKTLRLKLVNKGKVVELLRSQLENRNQTIAQHSCTMAGLHQENILLSEQLKQHKQEMQQLKTDLAAAESQQVEAENLERQQLTTQLEMQHRRLLAVTKQHRELQQLHSCANKEHRGVVLRLQGRLKSAQTELDRVRSTLRTLEGADSHAVDMQQEVTLKARVQHLEETLKKLDKEMSYQNAENQRQVRELAFVKEERRQLAHELDAVRSKDKHFRERIGELEAILHKMAESFANCQDFMQLKEQEFFRLKLKHVLDLKEFQGQNVTPPGLDSLTLSALSNLHPSMQDTCNTQMKATERRESPARGRRGALSLNLGGGPPSDNAAAPRRRSAPARVHRPAFSSIEQVRAVNEARQRKTCGSKPHFPKKTAELDAARDSHARSPLASTAKNAFFSPRRPSSGRKSPVHALLTSDPAHSWQTQQQQS